MCFFTGVFCTLNIVHALVTSFNKDTKEKGKMISKEQIY